MHRYLIYYKTEIESFSSYSYSETKYSNYDSVVVQANSAGEAYDNFMKEYNSKSNNAFISLSSKYTRALTISDLGELIKDEPADTKDTKEKQMDSDDNSWFENA